MPWEHCGAAVADDVGCPSCGLTKEQWSIKFDATRTFRVSRKPAALLNVELLDLDGCPVPREPFEAVLGDAAPLAGATDESGRASGPCAAARFTLTFPGLAPEEVTPPPTAETVADGFRCPTGRKQVFQLAGLLAEFVVEAEDDCVPLVGVSWTLRVPDGEPRTGTLDETKRVRVVCPVEWRDAELELELDLSTAGQLVTEFVIEEEHGANVLGVPWTATLPDGKTLEGKVDESRRVRVPTPKEHEGQHVSLTLHLREGELVVEGHPQRPVVTPQEQRELLPFACQQDGRETCQGLHLELLDALGRGVHDEPVLVTLPDGSGASLVTDASGHATSEGPEGECVVVFPERRAEDLKVPPGVVSGPALTLAPGLAKQLGDPGDLVAYRVATHERVRFELDGVLTEFLIEAEEGVKVEGTPFTVTRPDDTTFAGKVGKQPRVRVVTPHVDDHVLLELHFDDDHGLVEGEDHHQHRAAPAEPDGMSRMTLE